jgi:NADPH-dependent glutamate synthase beta subunit-like oxidoreductase
VSKDSLKVAIIGAGPAGIYAAEALLKAADESGIDTTIDVFDRVPTPFGLVRYGVAPDHVSIRSVRDTLDKILADSRLRFFGNVEIGDSEGNIAFASLRSMYNAVVASYGASVDRNLGIPGEDLSGSVSATEFVKWYTGHPDVPEDAFAHVLTHATSVAVIGVGNVAVDVTRILAKTRAELESTDMPEHVLEALSLSKIRTLHLIGRRGPAEASWTTKELRELGELDATDVRVDCPEPMLTASSERLIAENKVAARNVAVIADWVGREPVKKERSLTVHFYMQPTEILGANQVSGLRVERTTLDDEGRAVGTGEHMTLEVDAVIRSVGYRGLPLAEIPFDERKGVCTHIDGRVHDGDNPVAGLYVSGWIKRGPSGIIGTNKKDSVQTVAALLSDFESGKLPSVNDPADIADVIPGDFVSHSGWRKIDEAERNLGASRGRDRTTIHSRTQAVEIAHS